MPNPDWPGAPCYGCAMCTPSMEKQREDWTPYYDYKGAAWMNMMKDQMIEAMRNGTLEDWVTHGQAQYDVWRYYYVNDQAPFFRSSVSGLTADNHFIPAPLQQLKTGIAIRDVVCEQGLQLIIEAHDGSPACVKPGTAQILIEREWGTLRGVQTFLPYGDTNSNINNSLGVTALVEYAPINMNWNSGPNYHFYLKITSNSTAYLLGYDICGKDFCVKNNTLSVLLPITKLQIANYTQIGLSDTNHTWTYGDTINMKIEISSSLDNKTAYFLDFENSKIVP